MSVEEATDDFPEVFFSEATLRGTDVHREGAPFAHADHRIDFDGREAKNFVSFANRLKIFIEGIRVGEVDDV